MTLGVGLVIFGALAAAALGFHSGGFAGDLSAPAGSDAAAGNVIVARHFPQVSSNPANVVFVYPAPIWRDPAEVTLTQAILESSQAFRQLAGPFNPNGATIAPDEYARLYRELGPPARLGPSGTARGQDRPPPATTPTGRARSTSARTARRSSSRRRSPSATSRATSRSTPRRRSGASSLVRPKLRERSPAGSPGTRRRSTTSRPLRATI